MTSFHHQPEAQHPKSSDINKLPADYPIFTPVGSTGQCTSPCPLWVNRDRTIKGQNPPLSALPPKADMERRIQGSILPAVYECAP